MFNFNRRPILSGAEAAGRLVASVTTLFGRREPKTGKFLFLVAALLSGAAREASADCDPRAFLVMEIKTISQTFEQELAFVLTANEQEYETAKKSMGGSGGYGLISGSLNYTQAQERARSIAQSIRFDYKTSYALNYFAQTISGEALNAYVRCLERDKERPGLTLWLHERTGDFFKFRAFWVGVNGLDAAAKWDAAPTIDGGRVVSKPEAWLRGKTEEIVIKRDGNVDMLLDLKVGGQTRSAVVVKDPPAFVWKIRSVLSPNLLTARTSGPDPGCEAGSVTDCIVTTTPNGFFVPNSAAMVEGTTSQQRQYSQQFFIDAPNQICVRMNQSTTSCQVSQVAQGRLMALEKFPQVAE